MICTKCGINKPEIEFYWRNKKKSILHRECKLCFNKRHGNYYQEHKEKWINDYPNVRRRKQKQRKELRFEVLSYYGGSPPKCRCCGETIYEFLTIDHINNGGNKHRKSIGLGIKSGIFLYKWIIDNDFPKEFQVMCWNCNCGKMMNNGVCPHQNLNK